MLPSKLNGRHKKRADQLISLHKTKSRNTKLPPYKYDQLEKGLTSSCCHSLSISVGEKKIVCEICGAVEEVDSAVLRTVEELKILFPDMKITTNLVKDWCKVIESKKTLRRILKRNFRVIRNGKILYFE